MTFYVILRWILCCFMPYDLTEESVSNTNTIYVLAKRQTKQTKRESQGNFIIFQWILCYFLILAFTSQCRKMVRHTLKILQHLLRDFKSVSDNFTILQSKRLTSKILYFFHILCQVAGLLFLYLLKKSRNSLFSGGYKRPGDINWFMPRTHKNGQTHAKMLHDC